MTRYEDLTARIEALKSVQKTMIHGSTIATLTELQIRTLTTRRQMISISEACEIVEPFACLEPV